MSYFLMGEFEKSIRFYSILEMFFFCIQSKMYKIFVSLKEFEKRCGLREMNESAERSSWSSIFFKDIRHKLRTVEGLTHRYENEDE